MKDSFKKCVAEFIGTMVLTLFGCGTAVMLNCDTKDVASVLITALAFGLSIVAMAYCIGNVSGCHINPAVSLGVFLNGGMSAKEFGLYVVSQIAGAFAGSGILALITGDASKLGANSSAGCGVGTAIIVEVILTFVFVLTILGVTSKKENGSVAGIVIGLTLTFVHILGIPFTGTSVNPARSIAPAVISGQVSDLWIFIIAPLAGAAIAAGVWKLISAQKVAE